MATHVVKPIPSAIESEEIRQELERILSSKYFAHAQKKQKFLRLVCDFYLEGRAHELNEYLLGYEVFDRDNKYNPSTDPIVRVVAHEIRKKLDLYYKNEGASDSVRLDIPAGSYQPTFTLQTPEATVEVAQTEVPALSEVKVTPRRWRVPLVPLGLGIVVLGLVMMIVFLALSNLELRQERMKAIAAKDAANYGEVWAPFLQDDTPTLVVLSNPPVFRFANPSDPESLTKESIALTPEDIKALKEKIVTNPEILVKQSFGRATGDTSALDDQVVTKQNRIPRLILSTNSYTGMGEAIGLHYLTDLFRTADRGMVLKQSRTLSAEDLKNHNVILLGGVWVNEWSGKLPEKEDFVYTNNATIENQNPRPGEEREYIPQFDGRTGNLLVDYALITVKPNLSGANYVMVLAGIYSQGTEAAAEFVTNKKYRDQLNQQLKAVKELNGAPRYFQALLKVGVENSIPTTVSILALHELGQSEQ